MACGKDGMYAGTGWKEKFCVGMVADGGEGLGCVYPGGC